MSVIYVVLIPTCRKKQFAGSFSACANSEYIQGVYDKFIRQSFEGCKQTFEYV